LDLQLLGYGGKKTFPYNELDIEVDRKGEMI
jgi:hypothetical protein